jgi:hypothetical protein
MRPFPADLVRTANLDANQQARERRRLKGEQIERATKIALGPPRLSPQKSPIAGGVQDQQRIYRPACQRRYRCHLHWAVEEQLPGWHVRFEPANPSARYLIGFA